MDRVRSPVLALAVSAGLGFVVPVAAPGASLSSDRTLRVFSIAGSGSQRFSGDGGPATDAGLPGPVATAIEPDGSILVATGADGRVRRVTPRGRITTVAGNGHPGFSGDRGPARRASLFAGPLVAAPGGGFWIGADDRVRRVWPDGTITTVAGNGRQSEGLAGDGGPATATSLSIEGLARAPDGSLLVSDAVHHAIRRIARNGVITTAAGTGQDGPSMSPTSPGVSAASTPVDFPSDIDAFPDGGYVFAEEEEERIYRVDGLGLETVAAGNGDWQHPLRDGVPAVSGGLPFPHDVAALPDGSFVVAADFGQVGGVDSSGLYWHLAGADRRLRATRPYPGPGSGAVNGTGLRARAALVSPITVEAVPDGGVLITDLYANRVLYLAPTRTRRVALAITGMHETRRSRGRFAVVDMASTVEAARVVVRLHAGRLALGRPVIARSSAQGSFHAAVPLGHRHGLVDARATLITRRGVIVTDRAGIVVGAFPMAFARASAQRFNLATEYLPYPYRCHRFSAKRVDCANRRRYRRSAGPCRTSLQMVLRPDGLIDARQTDCGSNPRFPYHRGLTPVGGDDRILPVLASTYDYASEYRPECLEPHAEETHDEACRHGFGPGVPVGPVQG